MTDIDNIIIKANGEGLYRSFKLDRAGVDEENRTVDLAFSSETPVDRFFGREILDHSPGSVDLSRLNDGAPLLLDHDPSKQIGVIEKASIDGDRLGRARVRFSKSALGQEIFQDVIDGIRKKISVGYRVHKMDLEEKEDDDCTYRVTAWEPMEISVVPIPADAAVGVGRSNSTKTQNQTQNTHMSDTNTAAPTTETRNSGNDNGAVTITVDEKQVRAQEVTRTGDILSLARQHNVPSEDVEKFIREGKPVEAFQRHILDNVFRAEPKPENIGMSRKEIKRWSLIRAIRGHANNRLDGIEKEASDAMATLLGRAPEGFFIPNDVAHANPEENLDTTRKAALESIRALSAAVGSGGGFTVADDVLSSSFIELLRNRPKVAALGARSLSGLRGNVSIPTQSGGATAAWAAEGAAGSNTDQTFGQKTLTPHRLYAQTAYSKQLVAQSSMDIEMLVRDDIIQQLAIAKDLACINGSGAAGEPQGILNTSGTATSITFGGAPTWADVVGFETNVASSNADIGTMAYLTTASTRGKWKTTVKVSGTSADFLIDRDGSSNGYRLEVTEQVPSNKVIFGVWSELVMADWDGIDVVTDPYSLSSNNQIKLVINLHSDVMVRHPESFCFSTDAGNQ